MTLRRTAVVRSALVTALVAAAVTCAILAADPPAKNGAATSAAAPNSAAPASGATAPKVNNAKRNGGAPSGNGPNKSDASDNSSQGQGEDIVEIMGSNAACCVCHMTFLKEEMAKSHLKAKVGCVKCHGTSAAHANDEHIGATKPDIVFNRDQIDPSCVKCHETHNAPAKDVIARFVERKLPSSPQPACTECHGMHRIDKALDAQLKPQK